MAEVPQTAEDRSAVRNGLLRQAKAACVAGGHVEAERVLLEYFNFSVRCQLADALLDQITEPEELASLQEAVRTSEAGLKTLAAAAAAAASLLLMPDGTIPESAAAWVAAHLGAGRAYSVLSNLLEGFRGGFPELERRMRAGTAFLAWLGARGTLLCFTSAADVADYFGHLQQLGQAGAGRTQAGGGTGWNGSYKCSRRHGADFLAAPGLSWCPSSVCDSTSCGGGAHSCGALPLQASPACPLKHWCVTGDE